MFKTVTVPLYYTQLVIGLGKTQLDAVKQLNKTNPTLNLELHPGAGAVTYTAIWAPTHGSEKHYIFVCFGENYMDIDTITHESVHVVNNIFNHIGQKLDQDNDEAQAYLTGWVAGEIGLLINEYKKKKIKKDGKQSRKGKN